MATPNSHSSQPKPPRGDGGGGAPSVWIVVVSAVAAGLLLGLALGLLGRDGHGDSQRTGQAMAPTVSSTASLSPSPAPSRSPASTPAATTEPRTTPNATPTSERELREVRVLALYYLRGGADSDARLFREFRNIEVIDRRPVLAAVSALFRLRPLDPDYGNPWPAGSTVLATAKSADTVTVNLARTATAGSTSELVSRMAVQQLVYTAIAADPSVRRVLIQVEGRQLTQLWGHPIGRQPVSPAPPEDALAQVWINAPVEGGTVDRTCTVEGTADVLERTIFYEVTDPGGKAVQDGTVQASAATGTRGDWSVRLTLNPGRYVLRFFHRSAEDGSVQGLDTKAIRVT